MSLSPETRKLAEALILKHAQFCPRGRSLFSLPRKPELKKIHLLETQFEITHKRLAVTDCKLELRFYLGSLYTALENHLVRGQKIDVPLVDDDSDRASQLQRYWKAVNDTFKSTVLIDEAASLLICLMLLLPKEWKPYEQVWVAQEDAENPGGFADFYRKLRDKFNPESTTSARARRALAEQFLEYAKGLLSLQTSDGRGLTEQLLEDTRGVLSLPIMEQLHWTWFGVQLDWTLIWV